MPVLVAIVCDACGKEQVLGRTQSEATERAFVEGWDLVGFGGKNDCWWGPTCSTAGLRPPLQDLAEALVVVPAGVVRIVSEDDGEDC